MSNKELQQKVLDQIESLGISPRQYSRLNKADKLHVFPICPLYIYNLSRGLFDKCGKHGIAAIKEYFSKLDETNEDDSKSSNTRKG